MASAERPVGIVVGAGPAGILAAVNLARAGFSVHLMERHPSPLVCDSSDPDRQDSVLVAAGECFAAQPSLAMFSEALLAALWQFLLGCRTANPHLMGPA
jgi:2-polyprenyl-6-methoxyphenol hydroxylase-like FAD-dependent oxidoreductase